MPPDPFKSNSQKSKRSKTEYLEEAVQEAGSTHPENLPPMLVCPISGDFMKAPVITPEGFAYDREFIVKSLSQDSRDPQTRSPLDISKLKDFSELLSVIHSFAERRAAYMKFKKGFIQEVRDLVNQTVLPEKPALCLCPLSHELINIPVITAEGKIYDKYSLVTYGVTDEHGNSLSLKDVVVFREFNEQLKLYRSRFDAQLRKAVDQEAVQNEKRSQSILGFFSSFLGNSAFLDFGDERSLDEEEAGKASMEVKQKHWP